MVQKVCGRLGCAVLFKIIRACDQHALVGGQFADNQRAFLELCNADGKIDLVLQQIQQPIRQMQADLHIRVLFNKFRNDRGDVFVAKRHRAGQRNRTARGVFLVGDGVFGFLHFCENAQAVPVINIAFRRQVDPACCAIEQTHTQTFFKAGDPVGYHCRRMAQFTPGSRKVAKFGNTDKNLDVLKVGHGAGSS